MSSIVRALPGFVLLAAALGCPATTQLLLTNNAQESIDVLATPSQHLTAEIEPGEREGVHFDQECMLIRRRGVILRFLSERPPASYYRARFSYNELEGAFTEDERLVINPLDDNGEPVIVLRKGCERP